MRHFQNTHLSHGSPYFCHYGNANQRRPIETVSKTLGHQSIVTTQHYAKILDVKVAEDMSELQEKLMIMAKKE